MSGFRVGGEGIVDGGDGVMPTLFQGAEDAHQDGLAIGATLAAVAVTVFANDDGRADNPLGMIVVERNSRLVHKREQVVAVTAQAFDQTLGLLLFPRRIDHIRQTLVQPVAARLVLLSRQLVLSAAQPNRVAHQPPQLPDRRLTQAATAAGRVSRSTDLVRMQWTGLSC